MFALIKLLFIVILAIIFYFFTACARLTQKAGNYIVNGNNTISQSYESRNIFDNIFYEFIKIVREYKLCGSSESSIDEFVIVTGLYFYYVSFIYYILGYKPFIVSPLSDSLLEPIIRYVEDHKRTLHFECSAIRFYNIDFYTLDSLTFEFFQIYKTYIPLFEKMPKTKGPLTSDECKEFIVYMKNISSAIQNFIYTELSNGHQGENSDEIFQFELKDQRVQRTIIFEIQQMAITFSKELFAASILAR